MSLVLKNGLHQSKAHESILDIQREEQLVGYGTKVGDAAEGKADSLAKASLAPATARLPGIFEICRLHYSDDHEYIMQLETSETADIKAPDRLQILRLDIVPESGSGKRPT